MKKNYNLGLIRHLDARLRPLTRKAEAGDGRAQLALAERYLQGCSLPVDVAKSLAWYKRAALSRDSDVRLEARFMLATMILDNDKRLSDSKQDRIAVRFFEEVARSDHSRAISAKLNLGAMYCYGDRAGRDPRKGVRYLREVARAGQEACAGRVLGPFYLNGDGVPRNIVRAAHWLSFPAEAGDPEAQWMLGVLCASEKSLSRPTSEAIKWLSRAAAQGHPEATEHLQEMRADFSRFLNVSLPVGILHLPPNRRRMMMN